MPRRESDCVPRAPFRVREKDFLFLFLRSENCQMALLCGDFFLASWPFYPLPCVSSTAPVFIISSSAMKTAIGSVHRSPCPAENRASSLPSDRTRSAEDLFRLLPSADTSLLFSFSSFPSSTREVFSPFPEAPLLHGDHAANFFFFSSSATAKEAISARVRPPFSPPALWPHE